MSQPASGTSNASTIASASQPASMPAKREASSSPETQKRDVKSKCDTNEAVKDDESVPRALSVAELDALVVPLRAKKVEADAREEAISSREYDHSRLTQQQSKLESELKTSVRAFREHTVEVERAERLRDKHAAKATEERETIVSIKKSQDEGVDALRALNLQVETTAHQLAALASENDRLVAADKADKVKLSQLEYERAKAHVDDLSAKLAESTKKGRYGAVAKLGNRVFPPSPLASGGDRVHRVETTLFASDVRGAIARLI